MDEILQKLLQSELLSEETKTEIAKQWNESVESYKTQIKEETILEVRTELAEQWVKERDALIDKVDQFVAEGLQNELAELKSDIDRFRDLEAEYSERLVEEKHKLAEELASELDQLIDKIDSFFELRLAEEMEELKEDLEVVRQNEFGRKMFEAFATEFGAHFVDEDSVQTKLGIAEQKLKDAEQRLAEAEKTNSKMVREAKMQEVLAPLSGKKREQMEFVLRNVETAKLSEAYQYFIGRVLKEEVTPVQSAVITEENKQQQTTVVTGEEKTQVIAEEKQDEEKVAAFARLRKLALVK